ncbi:unnamed protein product [Gongylonema pulchrum]|uniref:Uncharacterized protein n=1 Tax=Gongylonema pulchrum TaxID=637853 RepID=A0A3P6R2K5_9BILA|nr:unnamed protein product [Gongylonema pulchrum]
MARNSKGSRRSPVAKAVPEDSKASLNTSKSKVPDENTGKEKPIKGKKVSSETQLTARELSKEKLQKLLSKGSHEKIEALAAGQEKTQEMSKEPDKKGSKESEKRGSKEPDKKGSKESPQNASREASKRASREASEEKEGDSE